MSDIILVPTDFTIVADCAVNHAIKLSTLLNAEIALLHVISKESEMTQAKSKLDEKVATIKTSFNIVAKPIVRIGNIFDDIGDVAAEINAKLIIMGTHGKKGIQHLTGSYALKVITNSSVPFIVVQERNIKNGYENIILPIDLLKENKKKVASTIAIANYFKSTVHVFAPLEADLGLQGTAKATMTMVVRELEAKKIKYTTKVADEKGGFVKQLMKFAGGVDADLITIINNDSNLPEFIAGPDETDMIANDSQIPVLVINSTQVLKENGAIF